MQKTYNSGGLTVIRYYLSRIRAYPLLLTGVLVAVPLTVLANVIIPALVAASVLSRLSQGDFNGSDIWGSFGPVLLLYTGLLFIGIFTWRVVDHFMWRLEMRVQRDIANQVFNALIQQTAQFHADNFTGSLVSQSNKLLAGYIRMSDTFIFQVLPMVFSILFTVGIMTFRAPLFAILLVLLSVAFIAVAIIASRPVRAASTKYGMAESAQTGFLADALTNVMAIKSFATGSYERRRFREATDHTHNLLYKLSRTHQKQMLGLGIANRTISALALTVAVVSVLRFKADIGTVFLILSYTTTIVEQLFQFGNSSLRNINRVIGDSKEMVDKLALVPEIVDPKRPESPNMRNGRVTFDDVTFQHNGADDALFENFSIDVKPGEKVGLVGHSGSGKTTFSRLLLRFSDIQSGSIAIDGQTITSVTQDDLHRTIAYVPQEPLLFHRSIRENIAYGVDVSEKQLAKAAKAAYADEFIVNLPHGYETLVGERGVKLSGGQRQRVAIARAMLKDAPVILLDEATSALDSQSEVLIQEALWKLMEGRTAIVIAHRLSTIQKMDRIIVLDNGRIVEQGSHAELLKNSGTYAELWAHQSGGFLSDD